ncbi:MAG: hypothetical protein K9K78_07340 [Spirochaetales bacterium]|nr:hypothetical protein [Spirochaetales bacterium]
MRSFVIYCGMSGKSNRKSDGKSLNYVQVVRWAARISAGISAGIILLILAGETVNEGLPALSAFSMQEAVLMVLFLVMWSGLLIGWRWELLGAVFCLDGLILFYLLNYLFSGEFPRGPWFMMLS